MFYAATAATEVVYTLHTHTHIPIIWLQNIYVYDTNLFHDQKCIYIIIWNCSLGICIAPLNLLDCSTHIVAISYIKAYTLYSRSDSTSFHNVKLNRVCLKDKIKINLFSSSVVVSVLFYVMHSDFVDCFRPFTLTELAYKVKFK